MSDGAGGGLVVLTQNAFGAGPRWDLRRAVLARRIARLSPDVVGLQEVHADAPDGRNSQAHELAALLGGYHVDFAPARRAADGGSEGVALLCRPGIRERSVESLTLDPEDFLDRSSQRVVLCATLEVAGGVVDAFVTHLSLSRRARARTVRELVSFAARERQKSRSHGAVLMGDFNALPSEEAVCYLQASAGDGSWLDAWAQAHPGKAGGTWPAGLPLRRIDYVFVQPGEGWAIARCERAPFSGSDHHGVAAWLRLGA